MRVQDKTIFLGLFPQKSQTTELQDPLKAIFERSHYGCSLPKLRFFDCWTFQPCLPKERCCQRLLPWARRSYYEVTHLTLHDPGAFKTLYFHNWCLCARRLEPLRYVAGRSVYALYIHRVGECPCMEYSSFRQRRNG